MMIICVSHNDEQNECFNDLLLFFFIISGSVIGRVEFNNWNEIKKVHAEKSSYVRYDASSENITLLKRLDADKNLNKITLRIYCEAKKPNTRNVSIDKCVTNLSAKVICSIKNALIVFKILTWTVYSFAEMYLKLIFDSFFL